MSPNDEPSTEPGQLHRLDPSERGQHPDLLRVREQYIRLAELTGLEVETLYGLTAHRFVGRFYAPSEREGLTPEAGAVGLPLWEPRLANRYLLSTANPRICPRCIAEHSTLLIPWALRHITTCPEHQLLLVDRCSGCGGALQVDLPRMCCRRCGLSLSRFAVTSIAAEDIGSAVGLLLWGAAGCAVPSSPLLEESPGPPDGPTHSLEPWALLYFYWRMAQLLIHVDGAADVDGGANGVVPALDADDGFQRRPLLTRASVVRAHRAMCAVHALVCGWPESWEALVDRLAHVAAREPDSAAARFPHKIYDSFRHDCFSWLRAAWDHSVVRRNRGRPVVERWLSYLRRTERSGGVGRHAVLTRREAARMLGVGERTLARELDGPAGGNERRGPARRTVRLIEQDRVRAMLQSRGSSIGTAEAGAICGLRPRVVAQLAARGLLSARFAAGSDGHPTWQFSRVGLEDSLRELVDRLPLRLSPENAPPSSGDAEEARAGAPRDAPLAFGRAVRRVAQFGIGLADLLVAVRDGDVPAFRTPASLSLSALWFLQDDLEAFARRAAARGRRQEVSLFRARGLLHCSKATLQRWADTGLLMPCRVVIRAHSVERRYDCDTLEAFRRRYVTSDELAERLGSTRTTVEIWARAGALPAVTGPGVDGGAKYRFDLTALTGTEMNAMSARQAASMLGVSRSTVYRWIGRSVLRPEQYTARRAYQFSRAHVEAVSRARREAASAQEPFDAPGGGTPS